MENLHQKELRPGTILYKDKYEIQKVLGLGGFGITYLAFHRGFNQSFAIKEFFINGFSVRQTENKTVHLQGMQPEKYQKYKQRFIEEAQLLAKLDHANIIRVIDVFEENGTAYFVMPYIEGQTLEKLITEKGRLSYDEAVNYIAQVAEAVEHVHSKKLLHRDIKPENIMITPENRTILIDFGSAREFVHDKTQSHTSMLTKGYAPIEQYSTTSKKGNYSDIYALGAVFYVTLTGRKPMDAGDRMLEIMPEPKELRADIPPEANRTIMKAMSMKPEHRHQTIKEFMDDLLNVAPSKPVDDDVIIPKSNRKIILFGLALLAVLTVSVFLLLFNNNMSRNETLANYPDDQTSELSKESDNYQTIAISFSNTVVENIFKEAPMIFVEGESFMMGSYSGEDDERPVTKVDLNDFYIGQYEVTQQLWVAVMRYNPSEFKGDKMPVQNISWNDAISFISKLNAMTYTSGKFSLPTEAEWEYAARGGNKSNHYQYSGSDNLDEVAWMENNSNETVHVVGLKKPNELYLYDMSGNVIEWTNSYYYDYSDGSSDYENKVFRGGRWNTDINTNRTTYRDYLGTGETDNSIGFRLVFKK